MLLLLNVKMLKSKKYKMGVAHGTNMEEKSAFTVLMGKAEGERYL